MERFFAKIVSDYVMLEDDDAFHLVKVMRARPSDKIEIVADEKLYLAQIISIKPLRIQVVKTLESHSELLCDIVLIACMLKGPKMDFVVQKATELGVEEIVIVQSSRTVVTIKPIERNYRMERFARIAREASCQSKRTRIPLVYRYIDLKDIANIEADYKMVAFEELAGSTSSFTECLSKIKKGQRVAVLIGPEGGLSEEEIAFLKKNKYVPFSLGRRILRAETASLNALSIIANHLEDN